MVDYHPYAEAVLEDPLPTYRRLRDEAPAYYVEDLDAWFLSRFADIWEVSLDFEALSSSQGSTPTQLLSKDTPHNEGLAGLDPPRHSQHRALISPTFKPGRVKQFEPALREIVRSLLDPLLEQGEMDALNDYAAQLAIRTVCMIGGFPTSDIPTMLLWVNAVFERESGRRGSTERGHQAMRDMFFYLFDLVKQARPNPDKTSGLLKLLLESDLEGGLSDFQIANYCSLLLIGGTDTFPKTLSNTLFRLHEHPEQKQRVMTDPSLIPQAFNETVRYDTPTQMLGRTIARDIEIHGQTMKTGSKLMFLWASADRDEREFPDPDLYDIDRRAPRILAFGAGPHLCLGMHIARLEARIALEELFASVDDFEVDTETAMAQRLRTEFVRGFTTLPIRLHRS